MKKKITILISIVILAALAIGGSTYALFVDSATNTGNTFMAGTLSIDSYRDGFDTIPGPMFYTTPNEGATPTNPSFKGLKPTGIWAPGDTHIRSLVVYNDASLDAVLDKVSAQVEADTKGMASQMNVAVYKILPKYLPNGTPFAPIPGDDCLDQDLLDHASRTINPLILMANAFGVEDLTQKLIENQVQCNAVRLYSGKLSDLVSVEQSFSQGVAMKSKNNQFVKRGCLLAFVVQLDKNAGNEYQDADAQFGFTVTARQAKNQ